MPLRASPMLRLLNRWRWLKIKKFGLHRRDILPKYRSEAAFYFEPMAAKPPASESEASLW